MDIDDLLFAEILQYFAIIAGSIFMLPQVLKTARTKSAAGLSAPMLILYALSCLLWLAYGAVIGSGGFVLANAVALVIAITQLLLIQQYAPTPGDH